jgi:N-formylglutamate deformylase
MRPVASFGDSPLPLVSTAVHAGHDLRPDLLERTALDDAVRRREEDPHTDRLTVAGGLPVVVHRSRFEVDLNRPREGAVYRNPDDAWGLELWREPLSDGQVEQSLHEYDEFYRELAVRLDDLARWGSFLVLDLHSYNHRRDGADRPAAPESENPEVNVGTGSLDRRRWGHVVDRFMEEMRSAPVRGAPLDVRENVRFQGGQLSRWVHERYDGVGCALAVEFKKTFMDEWTGEVDERRVDELTAALRGVIPTVLGELAVPSHA